MFASEASILRGQLVFCKYFSACIF
jgi:hypothetical protein